MTDPLTVAATAALLHVSRQTVERMIDRGDLVAVDIGNCVNSCYRIERFSALLLEADLTAKRAAKAEAKRLRIEELGAVMRGWRNGGDE
jgi:excisionase family DNA binding protein